MMHNIFYDILSTLTSSVILTLTFLLLYLIERKRYLLFWSISWLCFTLALFLRALCASGISSPLLLELSVALIYVNSVFMMMGVLSFINSSMQKRILAFFLTGFLLLTLLYYNTSLNYFINNFVFMISALIYCYTGVKLYLNTRHLGYGGKIAGVTIFIWGLHKADYMLVDKLTWFEPIGYHIAVALTLVSAVGIVLMHFEKVKKDVGSEEGLFLNVAEASKDIVFIVKYEPEMHVVYISPAVEKITGYSPAEVLDTVDIQNKLVLDYILSSNFITDFPNKSSNVNIRQVTSKSEKDIMLKYSHSDHYSMDGKLDKTVGFIKDVTYNVLVFDNIIERQDWYEAFFQKSPIIQILVNPETGYIVDANERFLNTYVYTIEEVRSKAFAELFEDSEKAAEFMNTEQSVDGLEILKHCTRENKVINVSIASYPIMFKGNYYIYIIINDVSSEVQVSTKLQEITTQHSAILKSISEGVLGLDIDGNVFFANRYAEQVLDLDTDKNQYNIHDLVIDSDKVQNKYCLKESTSFKLLDNADFETNYRGYMKSRDGEHIPVVIAMRMLNNTVKSQKFVMVFRDITKELENEASLLNQIKDNEVLLQEVHHRVKNNLQIICSLLSLQADKMNAEDESVRYLNNSISRIKSMALIHELLYQSTELNAINVKTYIERLIFDISCTLAFQDDIKFITDIDDINITLDRAVPCGLIITELITNAIKHAFDKDSVDKKIEISLHVSPDETLLTIRDNGNGGGKENSCSGLGLTVIHSLVKQIKGNINFENDNGTYVHIMLPYDFSQT